MMEDFNLTLSQLLNVFVLSVLHALIDFNQWWLPASEVVVNIENCETIVVCVVTEIAAYVEVIQPS